VGAIGVFHVGKGLAARASRETAGDRRNHVGRFHSCPVVPVQAAISNWVLLALPALGSVRRRPDSGFTSSPEDCASRCWAPAPLHVCSWTSVPLVGPACAGHDIRQMGAGGLPGLYY
jgi:hypothetical protein